MTIIVCVGLTIKARQELVIDISQVQENNSCEGKIILCMLGAWGLVINELMLSKNMFLKLDHQSFQSKN